MVHSSCSPYYRAIAFFILNYGHFFFFDSCEKETITNYCLTLLTLVFFSISELMCIGRHGFISLDILEFF
jgi:hypothetical protein